MITLSGLLNQFPADAARAMARYRHRIFIERLGWPLACPDGIESDEFDRPNTVYVLARDDAGNIRGCARLLPTTDAYLLSEIFPDLLDGAPAPRSSAIWEISRFASSDPELTRSLLAATIARAASEGARQLLTVSPLGVERLLRRMGVHAHRAGAPVRIHGKSVFACLIEIDAQTCTALLLAEHATLMTDGQSS